MGVAVRCGTSPWLYPQPFVNAPFPDKGFATLQCAAIGCLRHVRAMPAVCTNNAEAAHQPFTDTRACDAQVLPFCVALTFFVIVIFIIQTGNKNKTWPHALPEKTLLWVSAVVGAGMGLLCLCFLMPFLRKRVIAWEAEQSRRVAYEMVSS